MEQYIFDLDFKTSYNSHDFIESSCNRSAIEILKSTNFGVLPYPRSIIIYGPKSSGKTHFARICAMQFESGHFLQKSDNILDSNLLKHNFFVIDDLHMQDEEEVLHWFNICHEHKKYLLITSMPNVKVALKDLSSRILSLKSASLEKFDDELLKMVIIKIFSEYSITISMKIADLIIKKLPRDINVIRNVIDAINKNALSQKKKINTTFLSQFFN